MQGSRVRSFRLCAIIKRQSLLFLRRVVGVFLRFSDAIRLEFTSHDGDIGGGGDAESDPVTSYLEDLDEDAPVNHDGVVFFSSQNKHGFISVDYSWVFKVFMSLSSSRFESLIGS